MFFASPLFIFTLFVVISLPLYADKAQPSMGELCREVSDKLASVSMSNCLQQDMIADGQRSHQQRLIPYKIYPPFSNKKPLGRVLLMGGIHGDEYSTVSLVFKWMDKLNKYHSGLFHWKVTPLLNPDGLLKEGRSQRQNGKDVDLNRNFPSKDWEALALKYWNKRTKKNPRRFPGPYAGSEPETQWFVDSIQTFKPDVIIALHAPYGLVDYDGPQTAPKKLGSLGLSRLGTYPGSLGNYAGIDLGIPVVTVELASAGSMPSNREISDMWIDLVRWLKREVPKQRLKKSNDL
ncbi:MAG: M14 family zinc carboxypeptidase [Cellvibrionaceae bacterium]